MNHTLVYPLKSLCWVLFAIMLNACASIATPAARTQIATALAHAHQWTPRVVQTERFALWTLSPAQPVASNTLTIYIEGDGFAWANINTPSNDPTPAQPMALKLALADPTPAAYLARPCQYVMSEQAQHCDVRYWTSHRFAPEVIQASQQAIEQLKQQFGASQLILVGYSGGAAVAILLAAGRQDVIQLVTVGGNLDTDAWVKQHHLTPLSGSLNPADAWAAVQQIPQQHYLGANDQVIGLPVAQDYAARFPTATQPNISVIPAFDHHCCWETIWPQLVRQHFAAWPATAKNGASSFESH